MSDLIPNVTETDTMTEAKVVEWTTNPLTALDRCDRCPAQAYAEVVMPSDFVLHLCQHHLRTNFEILRKQAKVINDFTAVLYEETKPGANL